VCYLARALGWGDKAGLEEKVRHDKAIEAYTKYTRDRTKLLNWIATNTQIKAEAKQNFFITDYAFKLFNQAHTDERMILPKKKTSFQISINQANSRNKASFFLWAAAPSLSATQQTKVW